MTRRAWQYKGEGRQLNPKMRYKSFPKSKELARRTPGHLRQRIKSSERQSRDLKDAEYRLTLETKVVRKKMDQEYMKRVELKQALSESEERRRTQRKIKRGGQKKRRHSVRTHSRRTRKGSTTVKSHRRGGR